MSSNHKGFKEFVGVVCISMLFWACVIGTLFITYG